MLRLLFLKTRIAGEVVFYSEENVKDSKGIGLIKPHSNTTTIVKCSLGLLVKNIRTINGMYKGTVVADFVSATVAHFAIDTKCTPI